MGRVEKCCSLPSTTMPALPSPQCPRWEKRPEGQFLRNAVAYYDGLSITIKRLLTDNGTALRTRKFAAACAALAIRHMFTRTYRPQTNDKTEQSIRSALSEWADGWGYQNSAERTVVLASWRHHYSGHRPQSALATWCRSPDSVRWETTC